MTPHLPEPFNHLMRPLFRAWPVERAMPGLVVERAPEGAPVDTVEKILDDPALRDRPALAAGLWLYVDELDRSHRVSQAIESPTGAFWHGIMHRREGDFSNSHYWYRRAGWHPAMNRIDVAGGGAGSGTEVGHYDPHAFIDRVERAHQRGGDWAELVSLQRREWTALFEWCAEQ
ncbi:MAG: hypothetical protein WD009_02315 [Phycisphaeraceae bacterium]